MYAQLLESCCGAWPAYERNGKIVAPAKVRGGQLICKLRSLVWCGSVAGGRFAAPHGRQFWRFCILSEIIDCYLSLLAAANGTYVAKFVIIVIRYA